MVSSDLVTMRKGLISGRCLLPFSSSHSLFLPALFCSSVLTPFPFLSLQAKCEQASGRVRPRLNRPLHASNFRRVFGGGKCYRCRRAASRLFSPFNSRPYITHHPKSTPRAFFAALFLAILVPDSLDVHIKADEFLCPSFPSSHGFQICGLCFVVKLSHNKDFLRIAGIPMT